MSFGNFCEANDLANYLVEHEISSEVFCETLLNVIEEHGKLDDEVINEFLGRLGLGGISNLARGAAYMGGAAGAPVGAAARGTMGAAKAGANMLGRAAGAVGNAIGSGAKAVGNAAAAGAGAVGKGLDAMNKAGQAAAVREDLKQARVNITQLAQQIKRIGIPGNVLNQLMTALAAKEQEMGLSSGAAPAAARPTRPAPDFSFLNNMNVGSGKPDFSNWGK